jgi:hypothetical protein
LSRTSPQVRGFPNPIVKIWRFFLAAFASCFPYSDLTFWLRSLSRQQKLRLVACYSAVSRERKRADNAQLTVSLFFAIPAPSSISALKAESYPYVVSQRNQLIEDGSLIEKNGFLIFTKDAEFSSPSAAAAVVHGGSANGLVAWKTKEGISLKQLDEQA